MKTLSIPVLTWLCILPALARYSGGSGTAADPYQIATAFDLISLGETPDDYDEHFILTADIDLDPNLPGRKVFDRALIAPDVNPSTLHFEGAVFTGVLDGRGHTIWNLTITGGQYLGLFGWTGPGAAIRRLVLGRGTGPWNRFLYWQPRRPQRTRQHRRESQQRLRRGRFRCRGARWLQRVWADPCESQQQFGSRHGMGRRLPGGHEPGEHRHELRRRFRRRNRLGRRRPGGRQRREHHLESRMRLCLREVLCRWPGRRQRRACRHQLQQRRRDRDALLCRRPGGRAPGEHHDELQQQPGWRRFRCRRSRGGRGDRQHGESLILEHRDLGPGHQRRRHENICGRDADGRDVPGRRLGFRGCECGWDSRPSGRSPRAATILASRGSTGHSAATPAMGLWMFRRRQFSVGSQEIGCSPATCTSAMIRRQSPMRPPEATGSTGAASRRA